MIFWNVQICEQGDFAEQIAVLDGTQDRISVSAKENMQIVKEKCESITNKSINIPSYLIAPINDGDTVGNVVFELGDKTYTVDIVANESVPRASRNNIFTKIKKIFR